MGAHLVQGVRETLVKALGVFRVTLGLYTEKINIENLILSPRGIRIEILLETEQFNGINQE